MPRNDSTRGDDSTRAHLIEFLRRRMAAIEHPRLARVEAGSCRSLTDAPQPHRPQSWNLGTPEIDTLLGPGGLDVAACHEIKPDMAGDAARAAALAFVLGLACRQRQLRSRSRVLGEGESARMPILWCTTRHTAGEAGNLYGPGLAAAGLDPPCVILVEGRRTEDVLWALEQGLASGAVGLVVGCLDTVGLTPARRLSLAAASAGTPGLLLTLAHSPAAGAMATRWRIGPAPSAPHPFDAQAPGRSRLAVTLERCRRTPAASGAGWLVEWFPGSSTEVSAESNDDAHRFHMVAVLADREAAAARSIRRTG